MPTIDLFEEDPHPGGLRILFIGLANSSHTHSWIGLLENSGFNVRLFATPESGLPPEEWNIRTYYSASQLPAGLNPANRKTLYPTPEDWGRAEQLHFEEVKKRQEAENRRLELIRLRQEAENRRVENERKAEKRNPFLRIKRLYRDGIGVNPHSDRPIRILLAGFTLIAFAPFYLISPPKKQEPIIDEAGGEVDTEYEVDNQELPPINNDWQPQPKANSAGEWLTKIIREWQPDIIHTLGVFYHQGGEFFFRTRQQYSLQGLGKWVLQLRGGPELTMNRYNPELVPLINAIVHDADSILCDNTEYPVYLKQLGVDGNRFGSLIPVPGTGGLEVEKYAVRWPGLPSERTERIILWPKAYEDFPSKALPVLEAIKMAWEQIAPCEIYMLACNQEVRLWCAQMPEHIRDHLHLYTRIDRRETLDLMLRAKVMLAPSLMDGVPNVLYEAMACGAFPIVSPLETITPVVAEPDNVSFARNLYPDEIAKALIRAMNNDVMIDCAAKANLELVRRIADRNTIKQKLIAYYHEIVSENGLTG